MNVLRVLLKHLRFQLFFSTEESFVGLGYPGTVILYSVPWNRRRDTRSLKRIQGLVPSLTAAKFPRGGRNLPVPVLAELFGWL